MNLILSNVVLSTVYFVISFFQTECSDCQYKVTRHYLKNNCSIEDFFFISKVYVDSINKAGIPIHFHSDSTIICATKGNRDIPDEVRRELKDKNIPIDIYDKKFEPQKQIYFDQPNEYFEWFYFSPYHPEKKYSILPLKFEKLTWYRIFGLEYQGTNKYEIFIFISSDGMMKTFTNFAPGP